MYGMIHRALRQMVMECNGKEVWGRIETAAGIGHSELISAEVYDDAVTMRLIESAASCAKVGIDEFLIQFGQYWIIYAERGPLGSILHFTGGDISTFLRNLDRLHDGVQTVMPDARMPSFRVISEEPGTIVLDYHSSRSGLEPFVEGLLLGLLDRFKLLGSVSSAQAEGVVARYVLTFEHGPRP